MNIQLIVPMSILLTGLAAGSGANERADFPDRSLHGMDSVVVRFVGMDDDLVHYGLDRDRLESSIAALLNEAGIRVLHDADLPAAQTAGTLTVTLRLQTALYQFYLYNINISLRANLPLPAAGAYTTLETWSSGETGAVQPNALDRLESTTLLHVRHFVADYNEQK